MTKRDEALLGISATTFLLLCVAFGPKLACSLLICIGVGTLWFIACRRWPWLAWLSIGFLEGLLGSRRRRRW
jgi:hypothetical protein